MAAAANAEKAKGMQAYMKSTMPYYGINLPEVRAIRRGVFDTAAMYLLGASKNRDCLMPADMSMLEELVVSGAWWDHVDELAMVIGEMLRRYPRKVRPLMTRWSTDPNIWKRRVSIICQLRFKHETDLDLLYANIEPNLGDREFFIRKAIGWALRQFAWTDPHEVARYVRAHEDRLSGLSRREALKNIG